MSHPSARMAACGRCARGAVSTSRWMTSRPTSGVRLGSRVGVGSARRTSDARPTGLTPSASSPATGAGLKRTEMRHGRSSAAMTKATQAGESTGRRLDSELVDGRTPTVTRSRRSLVVAAHCWPTLASYAFPGLSSQRGWPTGAIGAGCAMARSSRSTTSSRSHVAGLIASPTSARSVVHATDGRAINGPFC